MSANQVFFNFREPECTDYRNYWQPTAILSSLSVQNSISRHAETLMAGLISFVNISGGV